MIIYKLEWNTPNNSPASSLVYGYSYNGVLGVNNSGTVNTSTYSGSGTLKNLEYYANKDSAEFKKSELERAASLIGFLMIGAFISEIEVID